MLRSASIPISRGALWKSYTNRKMTITTMSSEESQRSQVEEFNQQELATISLFNPTVENLEDTVMEDGIFRQLPDAPTPKFLQAPEKIPSLFSGLAKIAYVLKSPKTIQRNPAVVVSRGTSAYGLVRLYIPIEIISRSTNIYINSQL